MSFFNTPVSRNNWVYKRFMNPITKMESKQWYKLIGTKEYYCPSHLDSSKKYIILPEHLEEGQESKYVCNTCEKYANREIITDKGIVGWRAWRIDYHQYDTRFDDFRLCSLAYPTEWKALEKLEAINNRQGIANANPGIWSLNNYGLHILSGYRYQVFGQVYQWGKIIKHKYGYRSEFAYPKCFILPISGRLDWIDSKNINKYYLFNAFTNLEGKLHEKFYEHLLGFKVPITIVQNPEQLEETICKLETSKIDS